MEFLLKTIKMEENIKNVKDEEVLYDINCSSEENEENISAITFKEQRQILKAIKDEKYRNFFYFCCCTGVRVCEALNIKVSDINKRKKEIRITLCDTKTKKHQRNIPYLPELFKNMNLKNKEYLFDDITDEGSKKYFYNLYKKLNLDLSRHSTRHTFVSICTHIGIKPEIIQEWVGHTDIKMTVNTYTHNLNKGTSPILEYLKKLKKDVKVRELKAKERKQKNKSISKNKN